MRTPSQRPEDVPSAEWRSRLNERLERERARQIRLRRLSAGAAALAFLAFAGTGWQLLGRRAEPGRSVEAVIAQAHRETVGETEDVHAPHVDEL